MAITLTTQQGGTILPEWAETNSTTSRQIVNKDGEMVPVFSGDLNYALTKYLVDGDGKRIGIVNTDPTPGPGGIPQATTGGLYISPEAFAADLAADLALLAAFNTISAYKDGKIRADLISRKLL